jgi:hypothetical protein
MHTIIDDLIRWIRVHLFKVDPKSLPPIDLEDAKVAEGGEK